DQSNYSLASRYRAYERLARVQAALKRWDKVETSSNLMISALRSNLPSSATLAKVYYYLTMALTEQRKYQDAAVLADAYTATLPKLKSPEYIAEAYYVLLRAYAFNKDADKAKAIAQQAESFLKTPGVDKFAYVQHVKNGLATTANVVGNKAAVATGNAY